MTHLDRTQPTEREVYYAARRARDLLPPGEQTRLDALLRRASRGEKVDNAILKLLRPYDQARDWMVNALYLGGETRQYATLPGEVGPIPARSLWVCPKCGFQWRVLRKGRPVPPCPYDGTPLVPFTPESEDSDAG